MWGDGAGLGWADTCREAWHNVVHNVARPAVTVPCIALLAIVGMSSDVLAVRGMLDASVTYLASGAAMKTVVAHGAVGGVECDSMASVDGIGAAGAIRSSATDLGVAALPGATIPVFDVTPSFADLLVGHDVSERSSGATVMMPRVLAARLGVAVGDVLELDAASATVTSVYDWPEDGRRHDLGYALVLPVPAAGTFDECWAEVWPENDAVQGLLRATVRQAKVGASASPTSSAVNASLGASFTAADGFTARLTRLAPVLIGTGAGLVMWFTVRSRRLQLSALEHFGMDKADITAIVVAETAMALVPCVLSVGIAGAILVHEASAGRVVLWTLVADSCVAVVAGSLLGALLADSRVRGRHLREYLGQRA